MKACIDLFDQLRLEIGLERREDGTYWIRKLFPKFPERPANPHISIFTEPKDGFLTPHFTARNGRPGEFRRELASIAPARITAATEDFKVEAVRRMAEVLEAADLQALEEGGWSVHWADRRVFRRWMRAVYRRAGQFRVTSGSAVALMGHIVRHCALPTVLETLPPTRAMKLIALRWGKEQHEPELRILMFFPDGVPSVDAAGNPFLVAPAGWYSYSMEIAIGELWSRVVPQAAVEKAVHRVTGYLAKYPRRARQVEDDGLADVPPFVWKIFGFYAADLFQAAIAAVAEGASGLRQPAQGKRRRKQQGGRDPKARDRLRSCHRAGRSSLPSG